MRSKLEPKQPSQSGLDLAGAEMTASTVAGSRAIAAKAVLLDPTSFKFPLQFRNTAVATVPVILSNLSMLLLLHEQDKMAPDGSDPEVNNNNIRFSSEVILILGQANEHVI